MGTISSAIFLGARITSAASWEVVTARATITMREYMGQEGANSLGNMIVKSLAYLRGGGLMDLSILSNVAKCPSILGGY